MMTSLYPATNGVRQLRSPPAGATTLAEVFRDAGYATVSYSSIPFTGQMTNLHRGFDEAPRVGSLPDQESSKTARNTSIVSSWLTAHKDVPFFVFLHVSDPRSVQAARPDDAVERRGRGEGIGGRWRP
jgi:arylsulfatase A-like enzyme